MIWFAHAFGFLFSWPLLAITATGHFLYWITKLTVQFWIGVFRLPLRVIRRVL